MYDGVPAMIHAVSSPGSYYSHLPGGRHKYSRENLKMAAVNKTLLLRCQLALCLLLVKVRRDMGMVCHFSLKAPPVKRPQLEKLVASAAEIRLHAGKLERCSCLPACRRRTGAKLNSRRYKLFTATVKYRRQGRRLVDGRLG